MSAFPSLSRIKAFCESVYDIKPTRDIGQERKSYDNIQSIIFVTIKSLTCIMAFINAFDIGFSADDDFLANSWSALLLSITQDVSIKSLYFYC